MKFAALIIFLFSFSVFAQAKDYTCFAKANPERGFNHDFEIELKPAAIGGDMILKAGGKQIILGTISEVGTIDAQDAAMKPAFDATLGLIAEEDVSSVAAKDLAAISSLQIFKATAANGDEMLVYQLFKGSKQVGGTFMGSGLATACIKK